MSWEVTSSTLTGWVNFTKEVLLQEGGGNRMYPLRRRMFQRVKMDFNKDQRPEHSIFKKPPGSSVRGLGEANGNESAGARLSGLLVSCIKFRLYPLMMESHGLVFNQESMTKHITFRTVTPLESCRFSYQEVEVEARRPLHTSGELTWDRN